MLNILGMIILIIILFIIILLYIGVKIAFIYDKTGSKFEGCLNILILKKIKIYSREFPSKNIDEEEEEDDEDEESEIEIKDLIKLAKPCFKYFMEFIKSFVKCIHVKNLENHLVFGLDSYSDTAQYIGYIWGLMGIINASHKNAHLSAEPCFIVSTIDIKGTNELEINILKLLPPAVKLISKKEVRELIKGVRNG